MIIINGATGAIGQAIVDVLQNEQYPIIGLGRNQKKLRELEKAYKNFVGFEISNVTNQNEIDSLFEFLENRFDKDWCVSGYIHAVAEFRRFENVLDISIADWRNSIEINLNGTYLWNKNILNRMAKISRGSVVNIVSQAWKTGGFSAIGPYAASKAGIVGMTVNFAKLLGKQGLRVNCVSPGYVESPMMNDGLNSETLSNLAKQLPLNRFASPHEIANVCKFLISEDASYINGTVIDVSGGMVNP
jgi:NAD(P)-dependent dehydrogenase (short-subunit alcohol dehydrogenase family)